LKHIAFILNSPWTALGLFLALVSLPRKAKINWDKLAIIVWINSWWWAIFWMKGARAAAFGHVILLGDKTRDLDLEHELIHVEQYVRAPIIHPFLYAIELIRKGYRNNKYEEEAYRRSGNTYTKK
jgi:hypothetical protein